MGNTVGLRVRRGCQVRIRETTEVFHLICVSLAGQLWVHAGFVLRERGTGLKPAQGKLMDFEQRREKDGEKERAAMSMAELEDFRISLDEIKLGTDNFSAENYIGGGGFGKVYRGKLSVSRSHSTAAMKRLDAKSLQGKHEFLNEISMLFSYQHENIITFIGYCDEGNEMIVVYEYAINQSLDKYLCDTNKMSTMSWEQRLKICIGAAKGLDYLHSGLGEHHRVIHRDIKSANILLDENWVAKISDFGLSKIGPKDLPYTHLHTKVAGTLGYCDPNYYGTDVLKKESDVYSFGVVLFEMLSGRLVYKKRCNEDDEPESLVEWVRSYYKHGLDKIIDPHIRDQIKPMSLSMFTEIAYRCLKIKVKKRPTMATVVEKLEEALEFQVGKHDKMQELTPEEPKVMTLELLRNMDLNDVQKGKSRGQIVVESSHKPFADEQLPAEVDDANAIQKAPGGTPDSGILNIKVLRAMKLRKNDLKGAPDPYVKLKLTEDKVPARKTTVKHKNLNPEWNEEFNIVVKDHESQSLEIMVYDWEQVGKHDKMGTNVVPLKELTPEEPTTMTLDLLKNMDPNDVQNEKSWGQILVALLYKPFTDKQLPPEGTPGGGLLVVIIHQGEDLEGKHHTNPSVRLVFRGEERRTKSMQKNGYPTWEEGFTFTLEEPPTNDRVHLEVVSTSKRMGWLHPMESLGYVDIKLADVVSNKRINEKYHLIDSKNGALQVELQWITSA